MGNEWRDLMDAERIAELEAEVAHWREVAEKGLEPRLRRLHFEDGTFEAEYTGEVMNFIATAVVSQFKANGGENYFEMSLYDRDEPFQRYTVTVQKQGALSPAQKATKLEKALRHIQGVVGNPDASEGCRLAIKVAEEALA
jgi:hypothetical protein